MSGNKEVIFVSRPKDKIEDSNFKIQDKETPKLTQDGQVLLRTLYLSVDPYMRPKMTEAKSYTAMFDLDKTFFGPGLAQVVESRNENFKEKQIVRGIVRWNKTDVYSAQEIKESGLNVISPVLELSDYLHVTGFTGLTAYIGLIEIGKIKEGDVVLVSGAAGATGSIVGTIAKLKGASKVIGIVGSDEKAEISKKEFGFDEVINYKKENIEKRIDNLAPKGVNVYFDNVGGATLDAALINMAQNGRVVACGAIGSYGKKEPVMNYFSIIAKRLTVQGFIMSDHVEMIPAALKDLEQWAKEGKLKTRKTIDEGIENVVHALKGLFEGSNVGKAMVHIADPL